jgi:hypothetical protein
VPVRSPPLGAVRNPKSTQPFGRKDRPLGYRADESGRLGAEQILSHLGPDAVGADDYFSIDPHAVFEGEADYILILVEVDKTMVERNRAGGDNAFQNAMQIAPMDIDIGTAITRFTRRIELDLIHRLAGVPGTADIGLGPVSTRLCSMPRRRNAFIAFALRMIPAPIREKAGACSYTVTGKPLR